MKVTDNDMQAARRKLLADMPDLTGDHLERAAFGEVFFRHVPANIRSGAQLDAAYARYRAAKAPKAERTPAPTPTTKTKPAAPAAAKQETTMKKKPNTEAEYQRAVADVRAIADDPNADPDARAMANAALVRHGLRDARLVERSTAPRNEGTKLITPTMTSEQARAEIARRSTVRDARAAIGVSSSVASRETSSADARELDARMGLARPSSTPRWEGARYVTPVVTPAEARAELDRRAAMGGAR